MKATLELHLINKEEDRDMAGMGSRPRLRSIVAGLTPQGGQKADQEEWRPNAGESQFACFVREFEEQYKSVMPEFFEVPSSKPEPKIKKLTGPQAARNKKNK